VPPEPPPGPVVILNGAPRSGKTTIARALQAQADRIWVNLGVDASVAATPASSLPGLGLRPGGERPDLEPTVVALAVALFDSIAAHARQGLGVVADLGLHDDYARPRHLRAEGARRLTGLPVLFVGVRCPLDVIWQRRAATWGQDRAGADEDLTRAVERWEEAVHAGQRYDLEVDATRVPATSAAQILARLADGPPGSAFWQAGPGGGTDRRGRDS
jgi:chloramphenicol 3-O phosphotransferase